MRGISGGLLLIFFKERQNETKSCDIYWIIRTSQFYISCKILDSIYDKLWKYRN